MMISMGFRQSLRDEVLAQHIALRHALREVAACARRVLRGEGSGELPRRVQHLVRILLAHLEFEERTLLPLLHALDAHGRRQAARMVTEHRRQRAELAAIDPDRPGTADDPAAMAAAIHGLIDDLLQDMRAEEASLADLDPMRDHGAAR